MYLKKMAFLTLFVIILLMGILPFIPRGKLNGQGEHYIYISSSDIHTGFLFPKSEMGNLSNFIPPDFFNYSDYEGIDFSFGDKHFFEHVPNWEDLTLPLALNALFTPDYGLMHVNLYTRSPELDPSLKKIYLSTTQYNELVSFIKNSFKIHNGYPQQYKKLSYYGTDRFFLSTKRYYFLYTCNSWTGEGLRQTGVKTGILTPHTWGILYHLPSH